MRCASFASSPVSLSKNSRVPDFAIVPMFSITSWRDMPMPLSDTVIVRAPWSKLTRILSSGSLSNSALSVSASKRSLSHASDAFEIELAQEDLLVAVQGVDHQLQQLLDFGLEAERFAGLDHRHMFLVDSPRRNQRQCGGQRGIFKASGASVRSQTRLYPAWRRRQTCGFRPRVRAHSRTGTPTASTASSDQSRCRAYVEAARIEQVAAHQDEDRRHDRV